MDKKSLTPELKQVYERVMNTPVRSQFQTISSPTSPNIQQAPTQASSSLKQPIPPRMPTATAPASSVSSFSTVSPRPLKSSDTPIVFSAQRKNSESIQAHTVIAGRSSSDIAKYTMIGFLVILFIATYTFVWMVVLRMVELPI